MELKTFQLKSFNISENDPDHNMSLLEKNLSAFNSPLSQNSLSQRIKEEFERYKFKYAWKQDQARRSGLGFPHTMPPPTLERPEEECFERGHRVLSHITWKALCPVSDQSILPFSF